MGLILGIIVLLIAGIIVAAKASLEALIYEDSIILKLTGLAGLIVMVVIVVFIIVVLV